MDEDVVRAELEGGVLRIELSRPTARNAMDLDTALGLVAAVRAAGAAQVRCVLITGQGPDFSVGGDIRFFEAAGDRPADAARALASTLHVAVLGLASLEVPVVSVVRGWCAGAGIGLACGADVIFAGASARFRSAYTGIGFTPDLGLTWLLPRLVGPLHAADMMFTNRVVPAPEALALGLVSRVVADDELDTEAAAVAAQLANGPAGTHAVLRGLLRGRDLDALRAALRAEEIAVVERASSGEGREGVAAFLARRPPDFVRAGQSFAGSTE